MKLSHLIYRNLKKNLRNYYLYVFALIFSVALYFAFVTLQYDPALNEVESSSRGGAAIGAASVLLVAIVSIFLLYANTIFIKRRSKEIGLFQLIGLTKGKIFGILTCENLILYFGSMIAGIFAGFSASRLITMVLFKITEVEAQAVLSFSPEALIQTVIVFAVIYMMIMLMNWIFIKRQSILSLFRTMSVSESRVKKVSIGEMVIGLLGIALIVLGYYLSTRLFSGDFTDMNELFLVMIAILGSVILGTYLFYKASVSFIFNLIRRKKGGYLSLKGVLSLSSIMFRMKSNALLLTVITTVSALAIGLLSLSYISYYSAEKSAVQQVPNHFSITEEGDLQAFLQKLEQQGISYREVVREVIQVDVDASDIISAKLASSQQDKNSMMISVVSEAALPDVDVDPKETIFTGSSSILSEFMGLKEKGELKFKMAGGDVDLSLTGSRSESVVSFYFTNGGLPTAIVDKTVYEQLKQDINPDIQKKSSFYGGIDISDSNALKEANEVFAELGFASRNDYMSQQDLISDQRNNMGLIMFIVAFLGLAFLITSGCILYFKQMDESEEEKPNYTILRKLGYTRGDLLAGIQLKQVLNFGIPLVVGLVHSYFAVRSGWFFFGTELWTPMIMVMLLYAALYSIFGLLSVLYYKSVIRQAL
ncbi:FtsX-like permease family protein [Paenibacillus lemnae]|uniref:ABC transporter permease n=1 Tax=Paenibacillus lemnae TaxID=1330551 RepID=A0A848M609_PAELE|nr:ABC transporter permease [Paenibacillus lemnae]NMO96046.1 ABC transporter permease [Paenibacillus lemnae]